MKHLLLIFCLAAYGVVFSSGSVARAATVAPANAPTANTYSGKVLETTNAAGYTYILVDTGKEKVWAAAPRFSVKVGDKVSFSPEMPMPKYHSKTLNRDFDVVYFAPAVSVNGANATAGSATQLPQGHPDISALSGTNQPKLPSGHPDISGAPSGLPEGHPAIGAAAPTSSEVKGIKKAAGGQTVSEIYASQSKLNGKAVKVRGKVVKYNGNIMGKNWLHIQDGTGAPGSNDLLVTTSGEAKVGDTVVVNGTVATNKDFGAGYKYNVLLENAQLTKE